MSATKSIADTRERKKLLDAVTDARVRLTGARITLDLPEVQWLRAQWADRGESCRKELETCEKKHLERLQATISTLDGVLYRTTVEAFETDVKRAEEELKEYDGKLPLFAPKKAEADDEDEDGDGDESNLLNDVIGEVQEIDSRNAKVDAVDLSALTAQVAAKFPGWVVTRRTSDGGEKGLWARAPGDGVEVLAYSAEEMLERLAEADPAAAARAAKAEKKAASAASADAGGRKAKSKAGA